MDCAVKAGRQDPLDAFNEAPQLARREIRSCPTCGASSLPPATAAYCNIGRRDASVCQLSRCTKLGDLENNEWIVALKWETQQRNCI